MASKRGTTTTRLERNGDEYIGMVQYYPLEKVGLNTWIGDNYRYVIVEKGTTFELAEGGMFDRWEDAYNGMIEHFNYNLMNKKGSDQTHRLYFGNATNAPNNRPEDLRR